MSRCTFAALIPNKGTRKGMAYWQKYDNFAEVVYSIGGKGYEKIGIVTSRGKHVE